MNLDKLKELASKATPGPWEAASCGNPSCWCRVIMSRADAITEDDECVISSGSAGKDDAAFIAAANPSTVMALIEVAEKARAYLDSEGSGCGAEVEHESALRSALSRLEESNTGGLKEKDG